MATAKRDFYQDWDRQTTRLQGLRWSLQLADRTLSGIESVNVTLRSSVLSGQLGRHPAFSVKNEIYIHPNKVQDTLSDRGIATILGLNYHELAHVVYTFSDVERIKRAVDGATNFEDAYNILEEGRVETLLSARYPRLKKYFTLIVADLIIGSPDPDTYLLVHGRKYLPKKVRGVLRQNYAAAFGEPQTKQAEELIDRYRLLLYPQDMAEAGRIIKEFAKLIPASATAPNHSQAVAGANDGSNKMTQPEKQKQDQEKAEKGEEDGADDPDFQDGDTEADDDSSGAQDGGGQNPPGAGSQPGNRNPGELDGDDGEGGPEERGGGSSGDNGAGQKAGSGKGRDALSDRDIRGALEVLMEDILDSETVKTDVQNVRDVMDDMTNGLHSSMERHPAVRAHQHAVTTGMRERSERYAGELARIWQAMEPGWRYGVSDGSRLDMSRVFTAAMSDEDTEDVYADWSEGQQHNSAATGVIISDESASMDAAVRDSQGRSVGVRGLLAAQAIWCIKKACEQVDVKFCVITYDSSSRLLYELDDKVEHSTFIYPHNSGGTNAIDAIVEARRILSQVQTPGKFLISLTDGQWKESDVIAKSLASMTDVVKACGLIGFGEDSRWSYEKNFDIVRRTTGDVFWLMAETVTELMSRNLEGWY